MGHGPHILENIDYLVDDGDAFLLTNDLNDFSFDHILRKVKRLVIPSTRLNTHSIYSDTHTVFYTNALMMDNNCPGNRGVRRKIGLTVLHEEFRHITYNEKIRCDQFVGAKYVKKRLRKIQLYGNKEDGGKSDLIDYRIQGSNETKAEYADYQNGGFVFESNVNVYMDENKYMPDAESKSILFGTLAFYIPESVLGLYQNLGYKIMNCRQKLKERLLIQTSEDRNRRFGLNLGNSGITDKEKYHADTNEFVLKYICMIEWARVLVVYGIITYLHAHPILTHLKNLHSWSRLKKVIRNFWMLVFHGKFPYIGNIIMDR